MAEALVQAAGNSLERAVGTFQSTWAGLYQSNGLPTFQAEEQQRREEQAHLALAASIRQAMTVADDELGEVQASEGPVGQQDRDPVASLTPLDLTRATGLLPFIQADVNDLDTPTGRMRARMRAKATVAEGDKAACAVFLRLLADRDEFEDVCESLSAIVWPAKTTERKRLAERRSSALTLKMAATNAATMAKVGGAAVGNLRAYSMATGPYASGKI
jgi:hypothetical protein